MLTNHRLALATCVVAALVGWGCTPKTPADEEAQAAAPPPALVEPTAFGAEAGGLQLGIAVERVRYAVGEQVWISAAARNVGRTPLTLRLPLAAEPEVSFRQDVVTLEYELDDAQRVTIPAGESWSGTLAGALSLAPGTYRIRVVIRGEELAAGDADPAAPAWHGEARSNEVAIQVGGAAQE